MQSPEFARHFIAAFGLYSPEGHTMSDKLEGKVAVITGGSAGIGFGAARRFAAEGARVFITGRSQATLDEAVAAITPGQSLVLYDGDRVLGGGVIENGKRQLPVRAA